MTDMLIGPHVDKIYIKNKKASLCDNIKEAIRYTKDIANFDITAISIFVAGPRTYTVNVTNEEADDIRLLNLNIYVHNTYISYPWTLKPMAIHSIHTQMDVCNRMNATGFVIHLPKENDLDNILQVLHKLYNQLYSTRIYLEIPALKPCNAYFHKPKHINELFKRIKNELDHNLDYFGICIDTAHLWSSGVDLSDYKSAETWLYELDIDPKCILIHCNDNDKELGHAPDVHNALTDGKIWNEYKSNLQDSGLFAIIKYAKKYNIPIILERHTLKLLINDYVIIQQLI